MHYKKLNEIANISDSLHQTPTYVDEGIPMVRVTDVKPGYLSLDQCFQVSETDFMKFTANHIPHIGDIVISRVGSYGNFSYVASDNRFCLGQNTAIISPLINPEYLYYYLSSPLAKAQIESLVVGSTQKTISLKSIKELSIPIFDDFTHKKIASILGSIDRKINCNKRINQNLYEQIQTIYCKDFDPVSHEVTGVLSDICKLSTDKVQISDLSVSTYYSTENMQPNKAGAVDASSLPAVSQTTRCRKGDVLVSNIRPYFKKIVYVTEESGCSTDVLCFVPQPDYSAFLFGTLYMDRFFDYMVAGSKGTKMPRGDKQQIMKYPIVVPTAEAIIAFNAAVTPMLEQIAINNKENERLATMRDTLLPKLMSGELDVSEIEL